MLRAYLVAMGGRMLEKESFTACLMCLAFEFKYYTANLKFFYELYGNWGYNNFYLLAIMPPTNSKVIFSLFNISFIQQ